MVEVVIPKSLIKWIVAYRTISDLEYEFYLRELGIDMVHIRVEELEELQKFCGEISFQIDKRITASFTIPASVSSNLNRTVVKSLREFITHRIRKKRGIPKFN